MCLTRVDRQMPGDNTLIECGWKYFSGSAPVQFPHQRWKGSKIVPMDEWIKAEGVGSRPLLAYETGFHIFTDEKAAKKNNPHARRVYYRRVTAHGSDQQINTVVAQELYVPTDQDEWPPKGK